MALLCRKIQVFVQFKTVIKGAARYASKKAKNAAKENPYIIVRATKEDHPEILNLMWRAYCPDEPTIRGMELGYKRNAAIDEDAMHMMAEALTLVAKCKHDGSISAVSINRTSAPWDADLTDKLACQIACLKTRSLFHLNAHIERAPNLHQRLCTLKIFEIAMVFVKNTERRKGLARKLIVASRDLGLDCGYSAIRVDATSHFTALICEKLKFRLVHEIPYCSYLGRNNQPILNITPPHMSCKVYLHAPHLNLKTK